MPSYSIDELLKLPPAERMELALALWESLEPAETEALSLTDEQRAELDRRLAEAAADPHGGIPWEQVRRELFERD